MKRLTTTLFLTSLLCLASDGPLAAAERWSIGLTAKDAPIEALMVPGSSATVPTVLLIGGAQGQDASVAAVRQEVDAFEKLPAASRAFRLIAIPLANPDAVALQFPPSGTAYKENAESHVLWRWIGIHAPDLVLIAGNDGNASLTTALSENGVGLVGRIPSRTVSPQSGILQSLTTPIASSEAHRELDRRRGRSPRVMADELAKVYGHEFRQNTYIEAMALIAQLRLGNTAEVMKLAEPWLNGTQDPFARPSQSSLAAHMLFYEIAKRTGDARATRLVVRAANSGFTEDGSLREFMPLHGGWSDSVFMDIPILAAAGALSGERKYFDMAARHIAFMQKLVLRPDGLYRHTPLTDAAWGRGNAFPALGLALTLTEFPVDHPEYARILRSFQDHMKVLASYQDRDGLWRNVIDYPGAYPEISATAMIGFSMLRGVRNGWLPARTYQPVIDAAWRAVNARTGTKGRFVDACESTTKMKSTEEYLHRAALLGPDPRTGGMAMLFATEMAGLK